MTNILEILKQYKIDPSTSSSYLLMCDILSGLDNNIIESQKFVLFQHLEENEEIEYEIKWKSVCCLILPEYVGVYALHANNKFESVKFKTDEVNKICEKLNLLLTIKNAEIF